MLDLLQMLNYEHPHLKTYKNGNFEVIERCDQFHLMENDHPWMSIRKDYKEVTELFSHYYLAEGHCICTGMGFGIRESWLLNKKSVSKITVLEKNKEVIEYHQYNKSNFLEHVEVINCDASEYVGKCDTLLLDHYNQLDSKSMINDVRICQKNIEHKTLWFWMLEDIIYRVAERYRNHNLLGVPFDNKFNNQFNFEKKYTNFLDIYKDLKTKYDLSRLPDITLETLNMFIFMYKSNITTELFES